MASLDAAAAQLAYLAPFALATGLVVFGVLRLARHGGRRVAGVVAGLPIITAPALLLLAQQRGGDYAAQAAIGSAYGSAVFAAYALLHAMGARRWPPALALIFALLPTPWLAKAAAHWPHSPAAALLVAAVACIGVYRWLGAPVHPPTVAPAHPLRERSVALVSAAVSALTGLGSLWLPAALCGVLIALPIISACSAVHLHRHAGSAAVTAFMRGYVLGLLARALYCGLFAWLAWRTGGPLAFALALPAGLMAAAALAWLTRAAPTTEAPAVLSLPYTPQALPALAQQASAHQQHGHR